MSYAWTFGNGQTATGPTASTTYTSAGSYTIRLTVTDDAGVSRSTTRSIIVSNANQRPNAAFTAIPTSGPAPLLVSVDAGGSSDPDGVISNYSWNFGNGATATGLRTQTTYTTPGIYVITLTVTDNRGGTATATETVVVDPPQTVTDRVRLSSVGGFVYNYEGGAAGNLRVVTDAFGVVNVTGSGEYVGQGGSTARVTVGLERFLWFNAYSGGVRIVDPGNAKHERLRQRVPAAAVAAVGHVGARLGRREPGRRRQLQPHVHGRRPGMNVTAPHRSTARTARSLLLAVLSVAAVVLIACTPPDSGGTPGGGGVTTTIPGTTSSTVPGSTSTSTPPGGGNASTVTAGRQHSCVRRANATVACWGNNSFGQLGNGTTTPSAVPVTVTGLTDVVSLDAGGFHTCAVRDRRHRRVLGSEQLGSAR